MLVGRSIETSRLVTLVGDVVARRGRSVGVWGPPGSGKSALLAQVEAGPVSRAGILALTASGDSAESDIRAAVLHQLLGPVLRPRALPGAGGAALIRGVRDALADTDVASEVIADAVAAALDHLAIDVPTLVVVDDIDRVDSLSADVIVRLVHAARTWGMLIAGRRRLTGSTDPSDDVLLGPLNEKDSLLLVDSCAPTDPDSGTDDEQRRRLRIVDGIVERAAGNPGVLVLSTRALVTSEVLRADSTVDVSRRAHSAVATMWLARRDLSAHARKLGLMWAVSCDCPGPVPTPAVPEQLIDRVGLDELLELGLLVDMSEGPEPVHPLLPAAVLELAPSGEQRRAHVSLANALEQRGSDRYDLRFAWHRARAATSPDDAVASRLDDGVVAAGVALSPRERARCFDVAAALTVDADRRFVRWARVAEARLAAGDRDGAERALHRIDAGRAPIEARARVLLVEGLVAAASRTPQEAFERPILAAELLHELDTDLEVYALASAAEVSWWSGRTDWIERVCVLAAAVRTDDPRHIITIDAIRGCAALFSGDLDKAGEALRASLDAAGVAKTAHDHRIAGQAAMLLGDDLSAYRHLVDSAMLARVEGDVFQLSFTLQILASVQTWRGHPDHAEELIAEGRLLTSRVGDDRSLAFGLTMSAHGAGLRGSTHATRESADAALRIVTGRDIGYIADAAFWALGRTDLATGRLASALEVLQEITDTDSASTHAPTALFALPDLVEAAVRTGHPGIARAAIPRFAAWASAGSPWAAAVLPRLRALTADNEVDAERWFLAGSTDPDRPFERARTQLVHGEHLRRGRQRVRARVVLQEALTTFAELHVTAWEQRAATELSATAERARRGPEAATQLTPQELTVARLVAGGATNQQVAEQLYLSRKTVESHLHKVYTKLEIGSRKQLPEALASQA
ncbi:hypothetical protein RhoFasSB10_03894 [Rhodococcus fascians]|uniref:helix-turn-helix transcriptional regulator n=1 Tax=Nocardiaceae TaxID=85025 RepID=UPI001427CC08|nr:LuxR family transcriptional regulator [Rhodococcus sp. 06-221-2]NIL84656.1 hypothetical protein [Rhodococcus fascians]NIL91547.1 hypothetical protein [Rhodococcus fascians]